MKVNIPAFTLSEVEGPLGVFLFILAVQQVLSSIYERRTSGVFRGISDLQPPCLGEGPEAAVESFLDVVGETAAGQLFHT